MNVNLALDSKEVKAMLAKYPKRIDKATKTALSDTATFGQNIIVERTKRGRGVNGGFKGYSQGYLKHLRKKGWPTNVDLIYKNDMMSSMFARAKSKKLAIISFYGTPEKRKAVWNNKTRRFFDHTRGEMKKMRREFSKEFFRRMSRA
jgi:hypothetical protein